MGYKVEVTDFPMPHIYREGIKSGEFWWQGDKLYTYRHHKGYDPKHKWWLGLKGTDANPHTQAEILNPR